MGILSSVIGTIFSPAGIAMRVIAVRSLEE